MILLKGIDHERKGSAHSALFMRWS